MHLILERKAETLKRNTAFPSLKSSNTRTMIFKNRLYKLFHKISMKQREIGRKSSLKNLMKAPVNNRMSKVCTQVLITDKMQIPQQFFAIKSSKDLQKMKNLKNNSI